ncbi:nucleotidyltransferase domain-containing protein [Candidatus Aerophobetes bacterium]|nr:nucleotidyltransferase domain-containing protein [Candidatus Aerophobetes bacterium]
MSKILEKKYQTLDEFKERLLQSSVGNKIARIILFGSVLKEKPTKDSDIDLLVIATGDIKKVEDFCSKLSFDVLLKTGEGIEPLVYCIDQLQYPTSYFLYRVKNKGKEIYKMDEQRVKMEEARGYLSLAIHYLKAMINLAKKLIQELERKLS